MELGLTQDQIPASCPGSMLVCHSEPDMGLAGALAGYSCRLMRGFCGELHPEGRPFSFTMEIKVNFAHSLLLVLLSLCCVLPCTSAQTKISPRHHLAPWCKPGPTACATTSPCKNQRQAHLSTSPLSDLSQHNIAAPCERHGQPMCYHLPQGKSQLGPPATMDPCASWIQPHVPSPLLETELGQRSTASLGTRQLGPWTATSLFEPQPDPHPTVPLVIQSPAHIPLCSLM